MMAKGKLCEGTSTPHGVNVNISRQVAIVGVILPLFKGQKWVNIFTNSFGQAAVSLTAFPQFFLKGSIKKGGESVVF